MAAVNKRRLGTAGEELAVQYLLKNGCTILKTNYRVGRIGEIDIIALEREYICFIEVKSRRSTSYGTPAEAVTALKQRKIRQLAAMFLSNSSNFEKCARFDVIEIMLPENFNMENPINDKLLGCVNHIKNAF